MCVIFQRKYTQDLIVFMYWFSEIPSFLRIVPFAIRVSMLSLNSGGIDVVAVLEIKVNYMSPR